MTETGITYEDLSNMCQESDYVSMTRKDMKMLFGLSSNGKQYSCETVEQFATHLDANFPTINIQSPYAEFYISVGVKAARCNMHTKHSFTCAKGKTGAIKCRMAWKRSVRSKTEVLQILKIFDHLVDDFYCVGVEVSPGKRTWEYVDEGLLENARKVLVLDPQRPNELDSVVVN